MRRPALTSPSIILLPAMVLCLLTTWRDGQCQEETCRSLAEANPDAVISRITIDLRKIIEPADGFPAWFPSDRIQKLHIPTAEKTIRRELLFKEGERLDPDIVEETRRNLRALGYFRDEAMECRLCQDETVEVIVHLKETWSLVPIFSMRGVGGHQSVTGGLAEKNLFGWGKSLSAAYRSGLDYENVFIDESWTVSYSDPNVMGSRLNFSTTLQKLQSGESVSGVFQRPFYSLETSWAGALSGSHLKRRPPLIINGTTVADYIRVDNEAAVFAAIALNPGAPRIHRIGALYTYKEKSIRDFEPLPAASALGSPPPAPRGYTTSGPGLSYRGLGVHYVREERISRFDRTEDLNMGNDLALTVSASLEALGASRDECVFSLTDSQGYRFREGHLLMGKLTAYGRWNGRKAEDTKLSFRSDYFLRDTPLDAGVFLHTLHASVSCGYGVGLSSDTLFSLGWDTGLRGFASGSFTGNKLFLVSVEDRVFVSRHFFGLLAVGLVPFWDAGSVWEEGKDIAASDLRHDLGVGIRLGLPSCAGENILKADLGFPLGKRYSLGDCVVTLVTSTTF
jgi:outer membrane protein assembly factor BamA